MEARKSPINEKFQLGPFKIDGSKPRKDRFDDRRSAAKLVPSKTLFSLLN